MRYGWLPFLFIGIMILCLLVFIIAGLSHANPAVVIGSHGQLTIIYQGTATSPTVVIPPTGAPSYVYPGTAPIAVVPPMPTLMPALVMPPPMSMVP